jgi:ParB-like chromosome segregation protein Spo0J
MNDLEVHPLANIFPMLSDEALADLAEDIKANGQRVPILLDQEGRLLDGRNRLKACELAGVEPKAERLTNGADPLTLIVSLNIKRRNLTAGQRAIAAAQAWVYAEKEGLVQAKGRPGKLDKISNLIAQPREHFAKAFVWPVKAMFA